MTTDDDTPTDPTVGSRRCWRCLKTFDCPIEEVPVGAAEWWLCDDCQATLIGPARHARD